MKTIKAKAIGLFAASAFLMGSLVPVAAAPLMVAPASAAQAGSSVIDVQYRRDQPPVYRGHRGSRERRPGYRQHNGFWFPMAAFAAGAVIGGSSNNNGHRSERRGMNNHFSWCESRYRSYRASDNSYNAGNGVRRQCVSPR
ncbi:MAG: BA14K family protein [Allorhizobium sp.]